MVSNSLDSDQARSGSKLFAKVISGRQKSPLAGKELIRFVPESAQKVRSTRNVQTATPVQDPH